MYDIYLFDKDQTLSSPFPAWAREGEKAFRELSKVRADARGIDEAAFFDAFIAAYNQKREATQHDVAPFKVNTWYWNLGKMIEAVGILQPRNDTERALFAENDATICKAYETGRKNGVEAFAGIPETVAALDQRGDTLAILSDGRIGEIVNAMEKVDVPFAHFQAIACQDNEAGAGGDFSFDGGVFYYKGKKPDASCVDAALRLIDGFHGNKKSIVMIGDNKADALLARELQNALRGKNITVDFAWAAYGAALTEQAVRFNNDLLCDPYPLGRDANEAGIRQAGIVPDHILTTPQDILHIRPAMP